MDSAARHIKLTELGQKTLGLARARAAAATGYNSQHWRRRLADEFTSKLGFEAHGWQLDVSEAAYLGVDIICIAGTGSGKTMPFVMPLMAEKEKRVLLLSPLKVLQEEQARRFQEMGIPAAAINQDTFKGALKQGVLNGQFRALITSPEMCLHNNDLRNLLTDPAFSSTLMMVVIDEAHCISQWGGEFRTDYGKLAKLRSFVPPEIPFLAASATLPPKAVDELRTQLQYDPDNTFVVNLGNDRPNIHMSTMTVSSPQDFEAVIPFLTREPGVANTRSDLVKTCIFVNEVQLAMKLTRFLRERMPNVSDAIASMYALRDDGTKRRVMAEFKGGGPDGGIMILVATEAAGMGADIPNIELVIQLGVPSSLTVWLQRAGRCARSPRINGRAILFIEESAFKRQKRRSDAVLRPTDEPLAADGLDWVKKVEPALRKWIQTTTCRRDITDEYFDNPRPRKEPTGACCDRCDHKNDDATPAGLLVEVDLEAGVDGELAPEATEGVGEGLASVECGDTIDDTTGSSVSKEKAAATSYRRGKHLERVKEALVKFRFDIKRRFYTPSSVAATALLPDAILNTLASHLTVKTLADLQNKARVPWVLGSAHFDEAYGLVEEIDKAVVDEREGVKLARDAAALEKREEKKRKVAEAQAEKKRKKAEDAQRKAEAAAADKEAKRLERERLRALAKAERDKENAAQAHHAKAARAAHIQPVTPFREQTSVFMASPMPLGPWLQPGMPSTPAPTQYAVQHVWSLSEDTPVKPPRPLPRPRPLKRKEAPGEPSATPTTPIPSSHKRKQPSAQGGFTPESQAMFPSATS